MQSLLKLEDMGYIFGVDQLDIIYDFRSGTIPDADEVESLLLDLKENKCKVIDFLKARQIKIDHQLALERNYLPYSMGECYGRQLTRDNELFIHKLDKDVEVWTVYRVRHDRSNKEPIGDREILQTTSFTNAIERAEKYIDNFLKYIDKENWDI